MSQRIKTENVQISDIIDVYQSYLTPDSIGKYRFGHWNKEEVSNKIWDLSRQHIISNVIDGDEKNLKMIILSIEPIYNTEKYLLKAELQVNKNENYSPYLIHKVIFKQEEGVWVMENYFNAYMKYWEINGKGPIQYSYSPEYEFNDSLAQAASSFVLELHEKFKIPLPKKKINYVIAKDFDEFSNLLGFDYYSFVFTTGVTSTWNSTIRSMKGEFHAHELVHLVVKNSINFILNEGLATYIGSKIQDPETYYKQLKDIKNHVANRRDKDFNDYFVNEDIDFKKYSYKYPFGAYLCEFIVDEYGFETLRKILTYKTWKFNALKEAIQKETKTIFNKFSNKFEHYILESELGE